MGSRLFELGAYQEENENGLFAKEGERKYSCVIHPINHQEENIVIEGARTIEELT